MRHPFKKAPLRVTASRFLLRTQDSLPARTVIGGAHSHDRTREKFPPRNTPQIRSVRSGPARHPLLSDGLNGLETPAAEPRGNESKGPDGDGQTRQDGNFPAGSEPHGSCRREKTDKCASAERCDKPQGTKADARCAPGCLRSSPERLVGMAVVHAIGQSGDHEWSEGIPIVKTRMPGDDHTGPRVDVCAERRGLQAD